MLGIAACAGFLFGIGFGLIAVSSFQRGFSFDHALEAASWVFAAVLSIRGAFGLWGTVRDMAGNSASLTSEGVYLQFYESKQQRKIFLPWPDIMSVTIDPSRKARYCSVSARSGEVVRFSSFTFFRPKYVANVIAERAGRSLQRSSHRSTITNDMSGSSN
jgi:hypothetical protein